MSLIMNNALRRCCLIRNLYSSQLNPIKIHRPQQNYSSVVSTSKEYIPPSNEDEHFGGTKEKLSRAAKAYLERAQSYNEMMVEAKSEYSIGMRHLANMMGSDPETFTQADANAAIKYLFPSGIYDKKAHPHMLPPEQVFPARKAPQFDVTGRPSHYLFYTVHPQFYKLCHETVGLMKELDKFEDAEIRLHRDPNPEMKLSDAIVLNLKEATPTQNKHLKVDFKFPPLRIPQKFLYNLRKYLSGSSLVNKEELQQMIVEDITDRQYFEFGRMMDRLIAHPYSYRAKDVIMKYRNILVAASKSWEITQPKIGEDGRSYVSTYNCHRKRAVGDVTVISPGTGKVEINGQDISYFNDKQSREQAPSDDAVEGDCEINLV